MRVVPAVRRRPAVVLVAGLLPAALAVSNDVWLSCHSTADALSDAGARAAKLVVDEKSLSGSVHEGFSCTQCHADLAADNAAIPHPSRLAAADCSGCHTDVADLFKSSSVHASWMKLPEGAKSPCAACHGSHQIRSRKDPESATHPHHVADLCARCHGVGGAPGQDPVTQWKASVHGRSALDWEIEDAPTCTTCHKAHETKQIEDPAAPLNRRNRMNVCGQCHSSELRAILRGVHGKAWQAGRLYAPVCTDCHGSHDIQRIHDRGSHVYASQVSATCGQCHGDRDMTTRVGLRPDRVSTYQNSFHGKATRWKSASVANCASCHRYHDVRAGLDPASPVNPKNLQATCGRPDCHPGATRQFASLPVHAGAASPGESILRVLRVSYVLIISGTLVFMAVHHALEILALFRDRRRRRIKEAAHQATRVEVERRPPLAPPLSELVRKGGRWVIQRWDANMVVQHLALAVSFTALCLTGFALELPVVWASRLGSLGPSLFSLRGILHRVAAVILIGGALYHFYWIWRSRRGRRELAEIFPQPLHDLAELWKTVLWHLGLRDVPPPGRRYTYREKLEYWALVWGTAVMVATGIVLWSAASWPWVVVEVSRVIHSYEALLAFSAIVVWHMFGVQFRPGVAPTHPTWIDGSITPHQMQEEHAAEYQELIAWSGIDPEHQDAATIPGVEGLA